MWRCRGRFAPPAFRLRRSLHLGGGVPEPPAPNEPTAWCLMFTCRISAGWSCSVSWPQGTGTYPSSFITGHGDIPMSVRAMKAGAVEFLPKPFRDQDLLDAIHQSLARDRQARDSRRSARSCAAGLTRSRRGSARSCHVWWPVSSTSRSRATWAQPRGHGENAPPAGDGQDGRRVPRRPHQTRCSARPPPPKVVATWPKVA